MNINGALIIKLQQLQGCPLHSNHAVQGKANWMVLRALGATKGQRCSDPQVHGPKTGTEFSIPKDKVLEAFQALGIC